MMSLTDTTFIVVFVPLYKFSPKVKAKNNIYKDFFKQLRTPNFEL